MCLQVVCMCFWYNTNLTFQVLEQHQWTLHLFQRLLSFIEEDRLAFDFEMRRVIFGLTAIINADPQGLPQMVSARLPDIVQWLAQLASQMQEERLQKLRVKEKEYQAELNPGQ